MTEMCPEPQPDAGHTTAGSAPWWQRLFAIGRDIVHESGENNLPGAAAEVAFHMLFAFVPLLLFLTALSAFVSRAIGVSATIQNVQDWITSNLPAATQDVVSDQVRVVVESQSGSLLSIGAVLALWAAKNAMSSLITGLNRAFDVDEGRSWLLRTVIAIGLTVALGMATILASIFFLAGQTIGDHLAQALGVSRTWAHIWNLIRWPLIVALLIEGLAFLYWAGPNVQRRFRWLTPGTIAAVIAWGIATYGLQFYFAHFGSYVKTYGALGAVMAFLFWLYVMAFILLLGGEINAVVFRRGGGGSRLVQRASRPDADICPPPEPE